MPSSKRQNEKEVKHVEKKVTKIGLLRERVSFGVNTTENMQLSIKSKIFKELFHFLKSSRRQFIQIDRRFQAQYHLSKALSCCWTVQDSPAAMSGRYVSSSVLWDFSNEWISIYFKFSKTSNVRHRYNK